MRLVFTKRTQKIQAALRRSQWRERFFTFMLNDVEEHLRHGNDLAEDSRPVQAINRFDRLFKRHVEEDKKLL